MARRVGSGEAAQLIRTAASARRDRYISSALARLGYSQRPVEDLRVAIELARGQPGNLQLVVQRAKVVQRVLREAQDALQVLISGIEGEASLVALLALLDEEAQEAQEYAPLEALEADHSGRLHYRQGYVGLHRG